MKKIILYITTIFWMIVIYIFSSQNGIKSITISMKIVDVVRKILYPDFNKLDTITQNEIINNLNIYIRKGAHFFEYAILCLLIFLSLKTITKKKEAYIIPPVYCFLFALSDEFHQGHISGRVMALSDVLIDTFGALFVILLIVLFNIVRRKKNV